MAKQAQQLAQAQTKIKDLILQNQAFNTAIDLTEEQLNVSIRKSLVPNGSVSSVTRLSEQYPLISVEKLCGCSHRDVWSDSSGVIEPRRYEANWRQEKETMQDCLVLEQIQLIRQHLPK
ncbi:hypothetical protein [Xanthocytophaga agilis]|uniref:Uncharacterized protein n=1 Tax=Xanthocytophaga agilis TaxID=3048010 RepID=A0AAE3RBQ8_9BACT|nr:hypothetical protein [Xanthocytophaga agilis]MDJ1505269.1 hypothetical protein [Xanthocytophaga agilis]